MALPRILRVATTGHTLTVTALGDSLTAGYLVAAGFAELGVDRLAALFPAGRWALANHGLCGDTARGGRRRLPAALAATQTDLLVVEFGINDCFAGITAADFQATLAELVGDFRRRCPEGEVVLVPPPPVRWPSEERLLAPFREAVAAAGRQLVVPVAPVGRYWPTEGSAAELWLDDGVHPSSAGHELLAQALVEAVTGHGSGRLAR